MAVDILTAIKETAEDLEGSEFTHDPEATRYGIVQSEYDVYREGHKLPAQSVENITQPEYTAIYTDRYWAPLSCSQMPEGVDFVVFQFAVNAGGNAVKAIQYYLGVHVDGGIGPETLNAINARENVPQLISELFDVQSEYYDNIAEKNPNRNMKYLKGWHNRVIRAKIFLSTGLTEAAVAGVGLGTVTIVAILAILFLRARK
jgi:lysozyme family protein